MKKRVLAALLAVCMIVGTCVLFASAEGEKTYATTSNSYKTVDSNGNSVSLSGKQFKDLAGLEQASASVNHELKKVDKPTLSVSAEKVDDSNVSGLISGFNASDLYVASSGSLGPETKTVTFTVKVRPEKQYKYAILQTLKDASSEGDAAETPLVDGVHYNIAEWNTIKDATDPPFTYQFTVDNIERTESLVNLKLGLRFYGDNSYVNLNADEIAIIKAQVVRKDPKEKGYTTYANTVFDLSDQDSVILTTYLKDAGEADYYNFYGWVDGNGKILKKAKDCTETVVDGVSQYTWNACKANAGAVYAAYVEKVDRVTITYSCSGEGDFRAFSDDREIAKIGGGEKNMISVMKGRDVTFTFVPKEGWEVGKVVVDGKNITSFASIDFTSASTLVKTIRAIINATYKDTVGGQQESGSYTFESVSMPHDIYVEFVPMAVLEAPSGLDLPTVEAEGITLATGAAAENGEGGEGGNGGNGGTTVPAENGAAGNGGSAVSGVVNPATGSTGAIAVFAVLSVAAGAAFVTAKKKED